jgi:P-type Mg2+ transporter
VLLDKSLAVVADGVRLGRQTFANTLKYVRVTTSANFGNVLSMAAAAGLLPFLPLLPRQVLLLNFLSDVPAMTIAGDAVDPEQLQRPRAWKLLAVMLVLRTNRPFWRSRPGRALLLTSIAVAAVTTLLPYSPLAGLLGLAAVPAGILAALVGLTALYVIANEGIKRRFPPDDSAAGRTPPPAAGPSRPEAPTEADGTFGHRGSLDRRAGFHPQRLPSGDAPRRRGA